MGLFSSNKSSTTNQTTQNFYDQRSVNDAGGGILGSGNYVDSSADQTYVDGSTRNWLDASVNVTDSSSRYAYTDASQRTSIDASQRTTVDASQLWNIDGRQTYTDASSRYAYADNSDRSVFTQSVSDDRDVWYSDTRDLSNYQVDSRNLSTWDGSNRSTTNTTNNLQAVDPGLVRMAELNAGFLGAAAESQSDAVRFMSDASLGTLRNLGGSATDLFSLAASNSTRAWESTLDASGALLAGVLDGAMGAVKQTQALAGSALSQYQPAESKAADSLKWVVGLAVAGLVLATWARKG